MTTTVTSGLLSPKTDLSRVERAILICCRLDCHNPVVSGRSECASCEKDAHESKRQRQSQSDDEEEALVLERSPTDYYQNVAKRVESLSNQVRYVNERTALDFDDVMNQFKGMFNQMTSRMDTMERGYHQDTQSLLTRLQELEGRVTLL